MEPREFYTQDSPVAKRAVEIVESFEGLDSEEVINIWIHATAMVILSTTESGEDRERAIIGFCACVANAVKLNSEPTHIPS